MVQTIYLTHTLVQAHERPQEELKHPYVTFFCVAVGVPAAMVAAVSLFTTALVLPIALVCGW